jgi:hypothetical protein
MNGLLVILQEVAVDPTTFTLQWKLYILTMWIKEGQLEDLGSKYYQILQI